MKSVLSIIANIISVEESRPKIGNSRKGKVKISKARKGGKRKEIFSDKNAFQLNVSCPLADKCLDYIVNKFDHVQGGEWGGAGTDSQENNFEHVQGVRSQGGGGGRLLFPMWVGTMAGSSPCDLWQTNGIWSHGELPSHGQREWLTNRHYWKHYLPATSLEGGKNSNGIYIKTEIAQKVMKKKYSFVE